MAARIHINRQQFDRLMQQTLHGTVFQTALTAGALYVKGKVSIYPGVRRQKMVWSADEEKRAKQRRGFFFRLKHGLIDVPYKRGLSRTSEKLGQSWTVAERGKLSRVIGTNASYAQLVVGEKQAAYHEGNWKPIKQVIAEEEKRVGYEMEQIVRRLL